MRRDASRWVRERLDLAAIGERGDGQFLDQIGDGHRFAGLVRAAIAGAAERAAAPAGIPGNKTARRDQQLDSMLARRGQAVAQAGHGSPAGRLPPEPGGYAPQGVCSNAMPGRVEGAGPWAWPEVIYVSSGRAPRPARLGP